jgi:hypothetical protein
MARQYERSEVGILEWSTWWLTGPSSTDYQQISHRVGERAPFACFSALPKPEWRRILIA